MASDADEYGPQAIEILERISEGYYAIDREWRFIYVNRPAELFWSLRREDMLGRSMLELFPKFAGSPSHAAHREVLATGTPMRLEAVSTAAGIPVELSLHPTSSGLCCFFRDISRRLQLEQRMRDRDEMLALAELHAGIGVWDVDLTSQTVVGTPQFFRLHGLQPTQEPVPMSLTRDVRHPQDNDRVVRGFESAMADGADTYEVEYRVIRPDGQIRWIFGRGRVVRDVTGRPVRYSGVDIDVTDRKLQEDRLRVAAHELRHRANNLLAVIQAMARQTIRASASLDDFEARFEGRIKALADSNELLVRQDWRNVDLGSLVEAQLRPFVEADSTRASASGPPVPLSSKAVQTIGLVLHELATNASKYGAFSTPRGRVSIEWSLAGDAVRTVTLRWREAGGPPVVEPDRSGFGRFVTEKMVRASLNAIVTTEFRTEGLVWEAVFPLDEANGRGAA